MPTKYKPAAAADPAGLAAAKPPRKSALVLKLLSRAKGTTLAEIAEQTGWQPHSTRAFLSRLRTKGMTVTRDQRKCGETAYRIVSASSTPAIAAAEPAVQ